MSLASSTKRKLWPSVALHPPRQVGRVDRQAVAADPGPGGEPHEAERLGGRRVDRLPHVDAEVAARTSPARSPARCSRAGRCSPAAWPARPRAVRRRHGLVDDAWRRRPRTASQRGLVDAGHHLRRVGPASRSGCPGRCAPGCSRGGSPSRGQARTRPRGSAATCSCGGARVGWWTRGSRWRPGAGSAARRAGGRPRCRTGPAAPSRSGVGTVITATSKPAQRGGVATRPEACRRSSAGCSSSGGTSST